MLPRCLIIAGPTATGKTSLSVALAEALNGEIVNADSMQVYRGMNIGTAKPTLEEQKGIAHHLLDVVDPDELFNAAVYRTMALPVVSDIVSRKKTCLVTGGTGLYLKALAGGLFQCPAGDSEFRAALNRECDISGTVPLYERLKQNDPAAAERIHPNDRVRMIRALEILHLTHRRASDMILSHGFSDASLQPLKICLHMDRDALYQRINERSIAMVNAGLVEETERLLSKGYAPDLKPMTAIGYRHMIHYLQGTWSLDEAVSKLQRDTRRYAKRQLTWFKADPEYVWLRPDEYDVILKKAQAFLTGD